MNGLLRSRLSRLLFPEHTVNARLILGVIVLAATTAITPQAKSADWIPSVASHIPTLNQADAVRPVAVINREDIELSGMKNLGDLLLSRLPYNSFGMYRPFVVGGGRVAILINGRRISDSTFDFDTLPISGIERVEILGDSAAALRGGHAIGGAVNVVLKRDFEGLEVQASPAWTTQRGGDFGQGSVLWGGALGRGHITVGADLFRRETIIDKDRDYSRSSWTPGGSFAEANNVSTGGNTLFITREHTVARPLGTCEGNGYTGVLTNPLNIPGSGCGFAYADIKWHDHIGRYERESMFFNFDHPLGKNADVYLDFRAAWADTAERYAPSVGAFSFAPSNALSQQTIDALERDTGGPLPARVTVAHRFIGHGNRDWLTELGEYDVTLGFRGRFTDKIDYNTFVRYYRYDAFRTADTFVSQRLIQKAVDEGQYDVENPLSTSPRHLAAIRNTSLRQKHDWITDHKTARVSLSGPAFTLGGGDAQWAAGGIFAREERTHNHDYLDVNNRLHEAADVLGSAGNSSVGDRQRWSGFAELSLPLRKDWDLLFAGRVDEHNDVGETFSHQIASRYRLHKALALRGSWNRASRAPSLAALHQSDVITYPFVCDRRTIRDHSGECNRQQVRETFGGNPQLKPDDAESFSLGAVMDLAPFSLSVDWFQVEISDAPASLSAQTIIDLEAEGRLPAGVTVTRAGDRIHLIRSGLTNSGQEDVAGINVQANMDWKTDWADVFFAAYWSHLTEKENLVIGEREDHDHPRDRVHAFIRATRGSVTANWSVLAVSGYSNVVGTGRYKTWMGHNVTLRWQDALGVKGMDLAGGVINIGNRGPSSDGLGRNNITLDSAMGRTVFLTAKIAFDP